MKPVAQPCLPPAAYTDLQILEQEKGRLLRAHWQWAGLWEDVGKPGGLKADIAEVPIAIEQNPDESMRVNLVVGTTRAPLPGAEADRCGRFVFVRLNPATPQSLHAFLGDFAPVLEHASEGFDEVFLAQTEEWACNWKSGLEITLEGYHVATVHGQSYNVKKKPSNFGSAVPVGKPPRFNGPHSTHTGMMSPQMRTEMANIAHRLKISPSAIYTNYNHYTLFPNMTIGFSGGCLAFMQIYSPIGVGRMQLRYVYLLAKPIDPAKKPVPIIKSTLLKSWIDYTHLILGEDQIACEDFQRGVVHATRQGWVGAKAEKRLAHFHKHWRKNMPKNKDEARRRKTAG
jgi:phenylpropionate dioxygenase-like ring-hydroxylating dioxygenase large terminal subunit